MASRFRVGFACCLVAGGLFVLLKPFVWSTHETRVLRQARSALRNEDWAQAEHLANSVLKSQKNHTEALVIAGIAVGRQHRTEDSLRLLSHVPEEETIASMTGIRERGLRCLTLGRIAQAEECFETVLSHTPEDLTSRVELAKLMSFEGRGAEAQPHWMALIQAGKFRADELYMLSIPGMIHMRDDVLVGACERFEPDSGLHDLGPALRRLREHRFELVDRLISPLVTKFPGLGMVQSVKGRLHLERNELDHLLAWDRSLPESASNYSEVWYVRGLWATRVGQNRAAVRCLLEALNQNANHVEANYRLSQIFRQLGDVENSARFADRSQNLARLASATNDLRGNPDLRLIRIAVEELETLGRGWEALAWTKLAREISQIRSIDQPWMDEVTERLLARTRTSSAQIFPEKHPLVGIRIEDYPLPVWQKQKPQKSSVGEPQKPLVSAEELKAIRFTDQADQANLKIRFFNSMNPKVGMEHIFQTTGGGVAALDYDGDYWPDLYFGQGRPLPEKLAGFNEPQGMHRDRLFRNQGDGTFVDVSALAGLGDDRFSQGVTYGDFNSDGFPDIYVCNIGGNRFYSNNGDGTFTDITESTQTAGNHWSMSALIADLNGDGLSDLYVVNYLKSDQVLARSCRKNKRPITCAPTLFDSEIDRVFLNLGDGRFEDITKSAGIVTENGKGLGIIALRDAHSKKLNLFIANDTAANHYYQNATQLNGRPQFKESALLSGLAMNEAGITQASMGVAAGDSNSNGRTDLFITNFIADYNTLYLQQKSGTFSDESRLARMKSSSVQMLGFGTQFLDANLDGHLDLIVTNGHVDQTFATGEPYLMRPQFFMNQGRSFLEASPQTLGQFFQNKHVGRALVRLDWNRDGKDDACIVHLNRPVALLTNQTKTSNHWLALHLRGVRSSRDAVGARIEIQLKDRLLTRELTAGDGYQVANERKLVIGLGNEEQVLKVRVEWPSGKMQEFGPVLSDREWLLVEGQSPRLLSSPP
jgi:tetratricopeptide (TPR) repeat protein